MSDPILSWLTASSRSWQATVERLRALRALPGRKPGVCALHETIAAARPALLAALHRDLPATTLVVTPTPDAAERAFADLLYYFGEARAREIALLRSRDDAAGALESPSERSARVTLLEDLARGERRIVLAPIAAVRQYVMPRSRFEAVRVVLRPGDEAGWERLQERLFELGYARCDVVSAVGEYAVRGGIVDLFAAGADAPARIEFVGDAIESIRSFEIESQRSREAVERIEVSPWEDTGEAGSTIFEYLPANALVVLDDPATTAAVARALDEERDRERHTLLTEDHEFVEPPAPRASLADVGASAAAFATLVFPGGIEDAGPAWTAPALESFVFECRPVEHFDRRIELFSAAMREWAGQGERVFIVSAAVSRTIDLLRAAGLETGTDAGVTVNHGSIDAGFRIPALRMRVLGDREIFGAPPKRVKMRAVKEGVPVTLADLQGRRLRRARGARHRAVSRPAHRDDPRRDAGLPRSASTPAPTGCSCPSRRCIRSTKYGAAEGAAPRLSKMGGARLGAHEGARLRSAGEDRRRPRRALRASARSRRGHAFGAGHAVASRTRRSVSLRADARSSARRSTTTKADMETRRGRWTASCAATSATARPKSPCARPSRRSPTRSRSRCSCRRRCWPTQHYRTFSARFGALSGARRRALALQDRRKSSRRRCATWPRARSTSSSARTGCLQKDVVFRDLGLIVVDEEQRFGVMHKERLKQIRAPASTCSRSRRRRFRARCTCRCWACATSR